MTITVDKATIKTFREHDRLFEIILCGRTEAKDGQLYFLVELDTLKDFARCIEVLKDK